MNILTDILIITVGIGTVFVTAHYAIKSTVSIAKHFNLSDEFIGMTILAIGTSLPEIVTHIVGSAKIISGPERINGISALVLGSNIGSDVFQQNFLIGVVAVISVITVQKGPLWKDMGGLIGAAVILMLFSLNGLISRGEGALLIFIYILYLYLLKIYGMQDNSDMKKFMQSRRLLQEIFIVFVSFSLMAFAAHEVVESSLSVVEKTSISSSLFGVIVLGIASALPELTTALIAE